MLIGVSVEGMRRKVLMRGGVSGWGEEVVSIEEELLLRKF